MVAGRDILRGVKIAAYVFAGLLAWMVIRNLMTSLPVDPQAPAVADSDPAADRPSGHATAPMVPPPPPLPGQSQARGVRQGRPGAKSPAETHASVQIREVAGYSVSGPTLAGLSGTSGTVTPEPAAAITVKGDDQPAGIVIVVPPVRASQESRGKRWAKAVGRALHIGQ